jgi:catechol 2,3-dioxygenase-like lactoylglutathione lyase family enzyme
MPDEGADLKGPPVLPIDGSGSVDRGHTQFHNEGSVLKPLMLSGGTMVATDLDRSRRFYEEFCGFETVRHKPGALLLRDCNHSYGDHPYWYIEVVERDAIDHPQHVLNHWGLDLADEAAVDRCHAMALEHKEAYGIRKIQKVNRQHGAYSFYLMDLDSNWWEFEAYGGPRITLPDAVDVEPTYAPVALPDGPPRRLRRQNGGN